MTAHKALLYPPGAGDIPRWQALLVPAVLGERLGVDDLVVPGPSVTGKPTVSVTSA